MTKFELTQYGCLSCKDGYVEVGFGYLNLRG